MLFSRYTAECRTGSIAQIVSAAVFFSHVFLLSEPIFPETRSAVNKSLEGENDGGAIYSTPDRILWNDETWRVVKIRSWEMFGYTQALAVKMQE